MATLPLILLFLLVLIEIDVDFQELHRNIQENGVINFNNNANGTSVWRRRHRIGVKRHDNTNSTTTTSFVTDPFQSFFDRLFLVHEDTTSTNSNNGMMWLDDDLYFLPEDDNDIVLEEETAKKEKRTVQGYMDLIQSGEAKYAEEEEIEQKEQEEEGGKHRNLGESLVRRNVRERQLP